MKQVKPQDRRIANINNTNFKPWTMEDGSDSGQSLIQLNDSKPDGVGFHIFRMAPGATTESHRHMGDEEFYVIDGDLTDNDGTVYRPGDLVWMKDGTEHNSTTVNGCTLIVYIESAEIGVE